MRAFWLAEKHGPPPSRRRGADDLRQRLLLGTAAPLRGARARALPARAGERDLCRRLLWRAGANAIVQTQPRRATTTRMAPMSTRMRGTRKRSPSPSRESTSGRRSRRSSRHSFKRQRGYGCGEDTFDSGPGYRAVLGFPGGLHNKTMMRLLRGGPSQHYLRGGPPEDSDTLGLNKVWVYNTSATLLVGVPRGPVCSSTQPDWQVPKVVTTTSGVFCSGANAQRRRFARKIPHGGHRRPGVPVTRSPHLPRCMIQTYPVI